MLNEELIDLFRSLPPWESLAVALAIAYLLLAIRQNISLFEEIYGKSLIIQSTR